MNTTKEILTRQLNICLTLFIIGFLLSCTAEGQKLSINDATSRIVNGTIIPIENAPFMIQLRLKIDNFTICGGTLISLQHVLTAAHCFDDFPKHELFVAAGASFRNETGVERNISQVFIHPNRRGLLKADVAIIKLDEPFEENDKIKVHKNFCSELPAAGTYVRITGWGAKKSILDTNELVYNDFSNELRSVRVPIITNADCQRRVQPAFESKLVNENFDSFRHGLNTTMTCTYKKYYDACVTDSGGPGMYGDKLCLVVSGGIGCAYGDYPGFYTSVPAVLEFINEKLKL